MVLGSDLPMPPTSWGGAENIMWQQKLYLESQGHIVKILNAPKKKTIAGIKAQPWRYDVVHLHLDSISRTWCKLARWFHLRLALTSHFGYAAFPHLWSEKNPKYEGYFQAILQVPYQIVLSPEIRDMLIGRGYKGRIFVLPNGIDCAGMKFNAAPAPKQTILLGKIEDRKKQKFIGRVLEGKPVECDLIGPNEDPPFLGNGSNVRYLGTWNRDQVRNTLTDYAVMILISDGEAHAGVLLEAMAAGLSLVISAECAHNLDTDQPWIYLVDRDSGDLATVLTKAVQENPRYRSAIRKYCEETFDWSVIGPKYLDVLQAIAADARP